MSHSLFEGVHKLLRNVENAFHAPIPSSLGKDHTETFLNGLDINEWMHCAMLLAADEVMR